MLVTFPLLRYWGLHRNWYIMFHSRHNTTTYLQKLKGVLMWQFCLLEQVEVLSFMECSSCIWHFNMPHLPCGDIKSIVVMLSFFLQNNLVSIVPWRPIAKFQGILKQGCPKWVEMDCKLKLLRIHATFRDFITR